MYLDVWEYDSIIKTDIQGIFPFKGLLKRISIYSEIVILGENHAVLELKHIQLAINGKFGGMCHTSTALYFCGASKKSLHKPQAIFGNILFQINYRFIDYLQLLCLQFLSKTHKYFKKIEFGIKIVFFSTISIISI